MHSEFETKITTIKDIEDKIKNRYINYDHLADQKTSAEKKQDNKFELTKVDVNILPDYIVNNLDKYKSWIDQAILYLSKEQSYQLFFLKIYQIKDPADPL